LAVLTPVKYLQKELLKGQALGLVAADMGKPEQVTDDFIMAAIKQLVCLDQTKLPRNRQEFDQAVTRVKVMADASICGLGQAAPNPLLSVLKFFPEDLR
jgi:hypothetical protein